MKRTVLPKRRRAKSFFAAPEKAYEFEVEEARSVQEAMIPAEPLRDLGVEVEFKFRPVKDVGGDFLDYYWMTDRRVGFFLGDVVGKGLPAALYAALTVGILRGINKGDEAPNAVLEFLNHRLLDRAVPNRFCAVQYGMFNPRSGEISVSNAGLRPSPLHITANGCREIGDGGFPCGLFREATYDDHTLRLSPGDTVLLSTDGLMEAHNPKGRQFGLDRLKRACARNRNGCARNLLDGVFAAVDRFAAGAPQHDDMTAVALHVTR